MNKKIIAIIATSSLVLLIILSLSFSVPTDPVENSQIKDGIQFITIDAKGGYSPRLSNAKAGIPTQLIVKTNNTYDCSLSLVIRSIGYENFLPQTGETIIDLGTPKADEPLVGLCSMGMYSFKIEFEA
jgi:plastocyanin domain-containing protein